jgi:predicted PurR-regulated permease PerM
LGILLGVPIATVLYTLLKNDVRRREILEES